MKRLFTNLTFWVLTAITAGALMGHFFPATAVAMRPLGTTFIDIVKLFINPIIFLTITLGISGMNNLKKVGRVGGKALIYFEVVTTFALILGIAVAYIIKPGAGIAHTRALGSFSIMPAKTLKSEPAKTSPASTILSGLRRSGLSVP